MLSFVHRDGLPVAHHRRFMMFRSMLANGRTDPRLWDLDSSGPRCLHPPPTSSNEVFSINCLRDRRGNILYHVMPPLHQTFSSRYYHLAVPAASTAVECYRRDFTTITIAAQRLVDRGKLFKTLMSPTRPKRRRRPKPFVLPHREAAYIFKHSDFVAYEARQDRYFLYPHARAALLEGGILWRLAMECLDAQDALNGPSDSAHDFGEFFSLPDGTKVIDDCLTENERDLISGVYIVYTGAFVVYLSVVLILKVY
jgi:hypothetical protein